MPEASLRLRFANKYNMAPISKPNSRSTLHVLLFILIVGMIGVLFTVYSNLRSLSNAGAANCNPLFRTTPITYMQQPGSKLNSAINNVDGYTASSVAQKLLTREEYEQLEELAEVTRQPPQRSHGNIQHRNSTGHATCGPKRRLLFTLSTGHTGTMWLLRVLRCSSCAGRIEHEPKPALVAFPDALRNGFTATFDARKNEKLPVLLEMLKEGTRAPGLMYAETSHMFVKSWWDVFIDWLRREDPSGELFDIDIVVLRRNISSVVRSFLTDKSFWDPAFDIYHSTGGEYTLHHRQIALLPALYPHGAEDSVDEVLGYMADMELQFAKFRKNFPQFRYWDVRSEELYTLDGAVRLLKDMGLQPLSENCLKVLGTARPVNQHVSWKAPDLLQVPPEYFSMRAALYASKYRSLGIPFPEFPQMRPTFRCNTTAEPVAWCEGDLPTYDAATVSRTFAQFTNVSMNHRPVRPAIPLYAFP